MTSCSRSRSMYYVLALTIVMFGFESFWHNVVLKDMYAQTAVLWRPSADIARQAYLFVFRSFFMAIVINCLYASTLPAKTQACDVSVDGAAKKCGMSRGLKFGFAIGTLLGLFETASYITQPIPVALAGAWYIGCLLEGALIGLVLCFCYKKDGAGCA